MTRRHGGLVQYGFAIDQRTCIGCHACTVACKTEHDVPLGQFRTWVKYIDVGEFPNNSRDFGVLRCNHCADAPCVQICPTNALFKRDDGIVDFSSDACIGCKSCMQACPYDAIYIDEETHTAAKCNFCAHRVDEGLEPACVVVCPTESIWVGDLHDADSGIRRFLDDNSSAVRAPEQGTGPNVFYVGANPAVLDPLAAPPDDTYLWAAVDSHRRATAVDLPDPAFPKARTTLNTAHPRPWGWRVSTYLWTKSVAAGALMTTAIAMFAGHRLGDLGMLLAPSLALLFTVLTGVLLVWDLKRPLRFLFIFLRPNPRSWLVWGAVALSLFVAVCLAWLASGVADLPSVIDELRAPALVTGGLTAGYTAFLFGQAEGRDLWQSPVLFWHLLAQGVSAGSGALLVAVPFMNLATGGERFVVRAFVVSTAAHLLLTAAEYGRRHPTKGASAAARMVTRGRYRTAFWAGTVGVTALAAALASSQWNGVSVTAIAVLAGLLANAGLLVYETVFVRAGQDVPLS